ncbi:MAG: PAS domain S-box protein, partial [Acidobacteria bacterium]|nr:PAS domain S-box protein [Acidobacteriota bacterium]
MRTSVVTLGLFCGLPSWILSAQSSALYDAWRWTHFGVESGLPSRRVHQVLETSEAVWAATDLGLAWYDGFRWHDARGLPKSRIQALDQIPGSGTVVALADQVVYQGTRDGFRRLPLEHEGKPVHVLSMAVHPDHRLVLLVHEAGWVLYENGRLKVLHIGPQISLSRVIGAGGGAVWLNGERGLYRLRQEEPELVLRNPGAPPSNLTVFSLAENQAGLGLVSLLDPTGSGVGLWEWTSTTPPVRNSSEGLEVIQALDISPTGEPLAAYQSGEIRFRRAGKWMALEPVPAQMRQVLCLRYRPNGDLWVGTGNGLYLHKLYSQRWTSWREPLPSLRNRIHEILEARDGSHWMATGDGVVRRSPDGAVRWTQTIANRRLIDVTGLAEDAEGAIWISSGSRFDGAYRFDGFEWRHYGLREGLLDAPIHKIRLDPQGRLWFLGASNLPGAETGAVQYSRGVFVKWNRGKGLANDRVYAVAEGSDGALWFGTVTGIFRWKDGEWRHWLAGVSVFTLAVDHRNRLWFGRQNSGVGFLDEQGGQPHYLTQADGIPDDRVWELRVDHEGTLWMATEAGLGAYREDHWARFQLSSGLSNLVLWPVLPARDRIYVGTLGSGVQGLDRKEAKLPAPRVEVSPPFVDADQALLRWSAFAWWGDPPPDQIETRFRLDLGPWSRWTVDRSASLANLPAGAHSFQVQAAGLFGQLDANGATVSFQVLPPLYRRPQVAIPGLILLLALAGLAGLLIARRVRHAREIAASEARFRRLADSNIIGVILVDIHGGIVTANDVYLNLLGYSREDLRAGRLSWVDHTPPEYRHLDERALEQLRASGVYAPYEKELVRKDGSRVWVQLGGAFLEGSHDQVIAWVLDISERKRFERQQAAVAELGRIALAGLDLPSFFNRVVVVLAESLDVELTKILELLPAGDALLLRAGVGWKDGLVGRGAVGAGLDSQAGYTLQSKDPVVVEDLRVESRFHGPPLLSEHGVVSGMSVIIGSQERPFGVLGVHTVRRKTFTPDDVNFLQVVANLLATAIDRTRAEETLGELSGRLLNVQDEERRRIAR